MRIHTGLSVAPYNTYKLHIRNFIFITFIFMQQEKSRISVSCAQNSLHLAIVFGFICAITRASNHSIASIVGNAFRVRVTEANT